MTDVKYTPLVPIAPSVSLSVTNNNSMNFLNTKEPVMGPWMLVLIGSFFLHGTVFALGEMLSVTYAIMSPETFILYFATVSAALSLLGLIYMFWILAKGGNRVLGYPNLPIFTFEYFIPFFVCQAISATSQCWGLVKFMAFYVNFVDYLKYFTSIEVSSVSNQETLMLVSFMDAQGFVAKGYLFFIILLLLAYLQEIKPRYSHAMQLVIKAQKKLITPDQAAKELGVLNTMHETTK